MGVGTNGMRTNPCLGTKLPPVLDKYDKCVIETLHMWKKSDLFDDDEH